MRKKAKIEKASLSRKRCDELLRAYGYDIINSDNFKKTSEFIQHGSMTVNAHCIDVARCSLAISQRFHIPCNRRELVRGALLHDYFLYDWHDKYRADRVRFHGFFHPGIALKNAAREYQLTDREKDIIKKHMWPLTVVPPMCREAWIVTAADKYCSFMETVHLHKGHAKQLREHMQKNIKVQYQG